MDEMNVDQRQALDAGTQYQAPNCSPEHLALRAAARRAGQNEETLRNLLWLINAHDRLLGLRQIATNLLQILQPLEEQRTNAAGPEHDLEVFHGWSEVLRWIRDTYQEPAPARSRSESQSENPIMRFGVTRHPLYACLWHTPEDWYLVEPDAPVRSDQQIAVESALAARGQSRHVQLAHQLLPWQYSQLTLQELAHLLHQSSEAFRALPAVSEWNEAQLRTAELVTLIHVILWTGSSLERAWNLKVLTGKETGEYKGQQIRVADLLFEMDKPQWRMRPTSPPYKSEIPDPNNQAYPRAETFVLPDIAWTGAFLRLLVEQRTQNQAAARTEPTKQSSQESESDQHVAISRREDEGYFFLGDVEEYRDALKKWLRAPANDLTGRVTPGRIGSFLFNRLVAVTGDVMVAVVITGHDHAQARTQQFYATYSEAKLQEIYSEATADVVQQAHRAAGLTPPPPPKGHELVQGRFIGARLCAKLSEVQKAVSTLQERIEEARCIRDDAGSIEFHNLYTLHTVLFFGYATSMRAIRTPYIWPEKVDKETGFTFLSDKDDDAQHKTRLAWVPPDVVKQMQAYSNHISALASDRPDLRVWHDPCFFLADNGKPVEVRPKTLTEKMRPFLALPPNAHRRFIRHELLDAGCPPEVVNGWLGHAFQGEEPWGPYSSFSFEEYQSNLKQYLLQVLKGLGWKAIDSPYV